MKKVYCVKCKWYLADVLSDYRDDEGYYINIQHQCNSDNHLKFGNSIRSDILTSRTWCDTKNQNNNCPDYKRKWF
jgi:hypothetical protein